MSGAGDAPAPAVTDLAAAVAVLVEGGMSRRDAVAQVAAETNTPKRTVYQAALPDVRPVGDSPGYAR